MPAFGAVLGLSSHALFLEPMAYKADQLADLSYLAPTEAFPKAKAAALKALEIDPTLSEAHTVLAGMALNAAGAHCRSRPRALFRSLHRSRCYSERSKGACAACFRHRCYTV